MFDAHRIPTELKRAVLLGRKRVHWWLQRRRTAPNLCVFVTGQQRSGTNMVMDVLERSLDTDVYHETDPRAFANYEMRERGVIANLRENSPARCFVIKALCEGQWLPRLLDDFAPARALWVVRHYADVANSMALNFRTTAAVMKRIRDDRNAGGWRSRGMSDSTHALIRDLIADDISERAAAAVQWYMRNVLFFELRLQHEPRVQLVFYEPLVGQPQNEFERICRFVDLPYSTRLVRDVFATSVRKNRTPDLGSRIAGLCEDLWARFKSLEA